MSRKRKHAAAPEWTVLARMTPKPWTDAKRAELAELSISLGAITEAEAEAFIARQERESMEHEVWGNHRYMVHVDRRPDGTVESLSIRRQDRKPVRDWRDLQRIKNEIAGFEVEAVELFPADSRLVDTANQYWLWCLPPGEQFPLGFADRYTGDGEAGGSKQRPFPADASYTAS